MDLRERIVADPDILLGKPAVRGTRLSVSFILSLLAGGSGEAEIVKYYPSLTVEDIRACCLYASENLPGRTPLGSLRAASWTAMSGSWWKETRNRRSKICLRTGNKWRGSSLMKICRLSSLRCTCTHFLVIVRIRIFWILGLA